MMNLIVFAGAVPLGYAKELDEGDLVWCSGDLCRLQEKTRSNMHRSHGKETSGRREMEKGVMLGPEGHENCNLRL